MHSMGLDATTSPSALHLQACMGRHPFWKDLFKYLELYVFAHTYDLFSRNLLGFWCDWLSAWIYAIILALFWLEVLFEWECWRPIHLIAALYVHVELIRGISAFYWKSCNCLTCDPVFQSLVCLFLLFQ